jgi:hypothetical protein
LPATSPRNKRKNAKEIKYLLLELFVTVCGCLLAACLRLPACACLLAPACCKRNVVNENVTT